MRQLSAEDWSPPFCLEPPVLSSGSWAPVLRTQALLHEGARDNDGKPQDGGPCYGFARDKASPRRGPGRGQSTASGPGSSPGHSPRLCGQNSAAPGLE